MGVVEYLRGNQLHMSGDGHCDSSGYSAKYATYLWTLPLTYILLNYGFVHVSEQVVLWLWKRRVEMLP